MCGRIGELAGCVYGSTLYLERRGVPRDRDALQAHDLLVDEGRGGMPGFEWLAEPAHASRDVFRAGDPPGLAAAAASGLGLCAIPCIMGKTEPSLRRVETLGVGHSPLCLISGCWRARGTGRRVPRWQERDWSGPGLGDDREVLRIVTAIGLCVGGALAACRFAPSGETDGDDAAAAIDAPASDDGGDSDGAVIDGTVIDAAPTDAPADAPTDAAIDARTCPTAPSGCTSFTCVGTTHCYYLCNAQGWTAANGRCANAGLGCLATIDDVAENTCIATATNPAFPDLVWFGWRQSAGGAEPAGGWGWQCGSSSFVAGNWGQFEPNNQGNEDCGAMGLGGSWIDGDCATSLRFVCELP